ncbi:MAG: hypothetical protein QNK04_25340 [Myxococcota bacterium]|nr:hypothetical protein [Myxococcota bacterium]
MSGPEKPAFDPDVLRARYADERRKRLRDDGVDQYLDASGDLARLADTESYAGTAFTRPPVADSTRAGCRCRRSARPSSPPRHGARARRRAVSAGRPCFRWARAGHGARERCKCSTGALRRRSSVYLEPIAFLKAAVIGPHTSTGDHGSLNFDREVLGKMALEAAELRYNTTVHTIGDLTTAKRNRHASR